MFGSPQPFPPSTNHPHYHCCCYLKHDHYDITIIPIPITMVTSTVCSPHSQRFRHHFCDHCIITSTTLTMVITLTTTIITIITLSHHHDHQYHCRHYHDYQSSTTAHLASNPLGDLFPGDTEPPAAEILTPFLTLNLPILRDLSFSR